MTNAPVLFSADVETLGPDEQGVHDELDRAFDTILETTSGDYGHAVRAVHAKAHAIVEGTLTIEAGLAPELAQGLFARPGVHKVFIRLSTNAGDILPDAIALPRGLAMKVLDVEGERLPGAEGRAQDFIMVNGKVFQAKNAEAFLSSLKLLAKTTDRLEGTKTLASTVLQGVNAALQTVGWQSASLASLGGAPNIDPLGETYHSLTPFRYGDHIAKFALKPISEGLQALTGNKIDASGHPDAIRDTVQREMRDFAGEWAFCVQLCRDLEHQPIEDPTVEWKEDEAPFHKVATIKVAPQDSWDSERVALVDDRMRFSVWTGLAAHQPLGDINRARRQAYRHSADFRQSFNRCPIQEPGPAP